MKPSWTFAFVFALASSPALAGSRHAHGAHEHGVAKLDLAVDGKTAVVRFESPADGIFGFEHAPKTKDQRATVASQLAKLEKVAPGFVVFPAALGCKGKVEGIEAPAQKKPAKGAHGHDHDHDREHADEHDGHSEVTVRIGFACSQNIAGNRVRFSISKHFPRIRKVKIQGLSEKSQSGLTLKNDEGELQL